MQLSKHQRQAVVLYGSTLIGTVLGVLASIVNTRFLDPLNYGDVRYVQNIINFICSLLLFGYFLSGSRLLALTKNEERARRIRGAMVAILGCASFVLVLSLMVNWLWHRQTPNVAALFLVSLPVCFQPLFLNYINTTAQGDNHIGRLSAARLLPALIYVPTGYLIYKYCGATSTRMVLLQWGIATIVLLSIIISTRPKFRNLKPIFKELNEQNKTYGFQSYIGSLFMVACGYLAGIFLGLYNENNANVGFYTLAMSITAPLAMLPAIVGTTYYKQFATQDRIPTKVLRVTLLLTFGSCILFILLIQQLVSFLYSEAYSQVGIYSSWLALGFCLHGLGDMFNVYLGSHGKGAWIRNGGIASGTVKILGFAILVKFWDINGALCTVVLADTIYLSVMVYYYRIFTKKRTYAERA